MINKAPFLLIEPYEQYQVFMSMSVMYVYQKVKLLNQKIKSSPISMYYVLNSKIVIVDVEY